jgi:excinuclease ABC subunit B
LPSALDNRPLKFEEFESFCKDILYVSATPSEYEIARSGGTTNQIIRPTGLLDPIVEIRKSKGQIDHLIGEINKRAKMNERCLVTTLTKKMSEDLCRYLKDLGIRVQYLHSEIDTIERVEIIRDLRLSKFDCLIGINLLREGLDIPEVSLVAILDADKEGFLRSYTSLIQTAGRAARHFNGRVILYADNMTESIKRMVKTTNDRRAIQISYNTKHGITPIGIQKDIKEGIEAIKRVREIVMEPTGLEPEEFDMKDFITNLEAEMEKAARNLNFEKAIEIRNKIKSLRKI